MNRFADTKVGVLAIQGDYARYQYQLGRIGAMSVLVRLAPDLEGLDALIIPGGESTTMDIMLDRFNMRDSLREFGRSKPLFGTCAGMIMLASGIEDNLSNVTPLALMDIDVDRLGYGRQVHSFQDEITADLAGKQLQLTATFIRAPRVTRIGPGVTNLAVYDGDPVLVRQDTLLAASFHTELAEDTALLEYFLDEVCRPSTRLLHKR